MGNDEEAIKMLEKAIEVNPNYGKGYNNLAVYYFQKAHYDLAIEYSEKALALGFVDPVLLNALQSHWKDAKDDF